MHPLGGIKEKGYIVFNRWKFRFLGVKLGCGSCIKNKVYLQIMPDAEMKIGDNFAINSGDNHSPLCSNSLTSIFLERGATLYIGHNSGLSGGTIWCTESITIGNYVNIGGNCQIMDGDIHNTNWKLRREDRKTKVSYKKAPIVIEDDVWLGSNCIVLKGVRIGARSIIGAGSVVNKDIPSDCIAGGVPCKIIKRL